MTNAFFPFYPLGLRCNPFRALTDEEWVEVAVVPPPVQRALDDGFANLQIIGEMGFGKTTLLLYIAAAKRLSGRRVAYERIPEDGRTFHTAIQNLDCFLLDEAQRLDQKERQRLLNYAPKTSLILATHESLSPLFAARSLPLTIIYLDQTDQSHLKAVLNKRLAYFSLPSHSPAVFSDEAVQYLWNTYGRNIRAIEHYLYEYFQNLLAKKAPINHPIQLNQPLNDSTNQPARPRPLT